jgi:hypothetical protein
LASVLEMVMQALSKAALLAIGLSISGTAMADQYFGGPLPSLFADKSRLGTVCRMALTGPAACSI